MRALEELEAHVEKEARQEGFAALADLEAQRARYRLAREIAQLRKSHGLTQMQLSKRSGVPQSEISKIESASLNPSEVTLLRLLHPMGRTLAIVAPKATREVARAHRPAAKPRSASRSTSGRSR